MRFHVHQQISLYTVHVRHPFNEKKWCQWCELSTDSVINSNLYTIKELVVMEISIVDLRQRLYIPAIHKIAFHLPHVRIIVNHHCCNTHR